MDFLHFHYLDIIIQDMPHLIILISAQMLHSTFAIQQYPQHFLLQWEETISPHPEPHMLTPNDPYCSPKPNFIHESMRTEYSSDLFHPHL